MFSKALISATYKNGRPGQLTEEHEKAEHHRFKSEFLFKNTEIPKDVYVSRLIQHFLIIKALEKRLKKLRGTDQAEISAFFALSYLEQLWRTPGIKEDLRLLGVAPDAITDSEIAKTTTAYLQNIKTFSSKVLLAHFLLHVAGFMHGGNIIQRKYIDPSNELTTYQIPANQYDFSRIYSFLPEGRRLSALNVYQDMMKQIDHIALTEEEFAELLEQCKSIYGLMSGIYDDLCDMHTQQLRTVDYSSFGIVAGIVIIALILKILVDFLPATPGVSPSL